MSRWWKGIKNHFCQQIKEDGVLYTGVFWFFVGLALSLFEGLLIAMSSSGSDGFLYKLIGADTKLQLIQTLGSGHTRMLSRPRGDGSSKKSESCKRDRGRQQIRLQRIK